MRARFLVRPVCVCARARTLKICPGPTRDVGNTKICSHALATNALQEGKRQLAATELGEIGPQKKSRAEDAQGVFVGCPWTICRNIQDLISVLVLDLDLSSVVRAGAPVAGDGPPRYGARHTVQAMVPFGCRDYRQCRRSPRPRSPPSLRSSAGARGS
jgi:hypothetical protein